MSGPRVPAVDPVALAAQLRVVLGEIDAGRMVATMSTRARIEGAIVALDVVAGADPATIVNRLTDPS